MGDVERPRLTGDGAAMAAELNYGHNPLAYLCAERPDEQAHVAHELCVACADGVEALTWKRRTEDLRRSLAALADFMELTPLSERHSGQISERTEAFRDAATMIRLRIESVK